MIIAAALRWRLLLPAAAGVFLVLDFLDTALSAMNWLALDIGGANLKLADGRGFAESYAFAMWKDSQHLAQELRALIAAAPRSDHLVVTMTGELADCFATKEEGVTYILSSVEAAADGRHTRVYLNNGMIVSPRVALQRPLEAASSNWHALASFCGRYAQGPSHGHRATDESHATVSDGQQERDTQGKPTDEKATDEKPTDEKVTDEKAAQDKAARQPDRPAKGPAALLLDVGSTTCDLVPLIGGKPDPEGRSDTERLLSGELVYTGVERSPVCAVVRSVPYRGKMCPVAQEFFATTLDAYVTLGDFAESESTTHTADGQPATKAACRSRLARVICASGQQFGEQDAMAVARAVAEAQTVHVESALRLVIQRMGRPPETVILSGHGEFLARRVLQRAGIGSRVVSLNRELGPLVSRCAPAHALAVLVREASDQ